MIKYCYPKICKELLKLNKKTTQLKNQQRTLNRCFFKEGIKMASKPMERCLTSLVIREIQIKTTRRNHLTPVWMARLKKTDNNKCWGGEIGPLYMTVGNVKWYMHFGKQLIVPQNVKHRVTLWLINSSPRYPPKGNENTATRRPVHKCAQEHYS